MEFRQLQTFMMIAQTESFSKAADILGYSQSADTSVRERTGYTSL